MHGLYTAQNASAATETKLDEVHNKVVLAISRIDNARPAKDVRTVKESIMLLQFVLNYLHSERCSVTKACENAVKIFCWDNKTVFRIVNNYLDSAAVVPVLTAKKLRGRAAELFKERYGEQFMVLKREHAVEILKYVTLANQERGGMVTVGRIQAYLLARFGQLFKKCTIKYYLTKWL